MRLRQAKAEAIDRQNMSKTFDYEPKDILLSSQKDLSEYYKESLISLAKMQPFFSSRTLRRTIRSKDNSHQPIWDMPDPYEVIIPLDLHTHEIDVLEKAACIALENSKTDVKWRAVCNIISPLCYVLT